MDEKIQVAAAEGSAVSHKTWFRIKRGNELIMSMSSEMIKNIFGYERQNESLSNMQRICSFSL